MPRRLEEETSTHLLVTEIQRVTHILGLRVEALLEDLHLSQAESHVLSLLAGPGRATVAELQRGVRHRTSTLTGIIDRLSDKGLVERLINPADRRSFLIELTKEGRSVAQRVVAVMAGIETQLLTDHSRARLSVFRKILASLGGESED